MQKDEFNYPLGTIALGDAADIRQGRAAFAEQAVDECLAHSGPYPYSLRRTTLAGTAEVADRGTFDGRFRRTLRFVPAEPGDGAGWWIERTDLPGQFPVPVVPQSVRSAARNIVLRAGADENRLRMVEHIIALKIGLGVDDLTVQAEADDPPLFARSSMDLVEAFQNAGRKESEELARFVTVREPITFGSGRQDFLTFLPAEPGQRLLRIDCAVSFRSAIGEQRIVFDVTPETFARGAFARTNAPYPLYLYMRTLGKLSKATRHTGYDLTNILIHREREYLNPPRLNESGKALEPVWHRATLDLLAAVSLIPGRLCGTVVSYRAGHVQDCRAVAYLLRNRLLVPAV